METREKFRGEEFKQFGKADPLNPADPMNAVTPKTESEKLIILALGLEVVIGIISLVLTAIPLIPHRVPKCPNCGLPEKKILDTGESVCARGHTWRDTRD